jgi:hypothetical protein
MAKKVVKVRAVKELNVLGHRVPVTYKQLDGATRGQFMVIDREIEIDPQFVRNKYDHDFTLLHELIHAILEMNGMANDLPLIVEHVLTDTITNCVLANFDIVPKKNIF